MLELEENQEEEEGEQQLCTLEVEGNDEGGAIDQLEEEVEVEETGGVSISLNALNGVTGFQTLRFTGYTEKGPLRVLSDTGRTHNFIDTTVARRFGYVTQEVTPQSVSVADSSTVQAIEVCKDIMVVTKYHLPS